MAFSWTLLCILAMEALVDTRGKDIMIRSTRDSLQVLCTSVACACSLILISSISCSHFSFSSAMWDSTSKSATYIYVYRNAANQWEGKEARLINYIYCNKNDHVLLNKDRGEADCSEKDYCLPCCVLSASQSVLWAAQHRPTSPDTLSPIVTRDTCNLQSEGQSHKICCMICMFNLTL